MPALASIAVDLLGRDGDPGALSSGQMALRAVIVFAYGLALLRLAGPRILARYSAVDVVVAIVLGSVLSRVVNGSAPMVPTLVAAAVVVALQRLMAALAWWSRAVGRALKGRSTRLVVADVADSHAMARHSVSPHDLDEAVRLAGYDPERKPVDQAWLERDGRISIVPKRDAAQIRNVPDGTPRMP
jgi:uncharacterized membrane protein YcaP (DUF421 family)